MSNVREISLETGAMSINRAYKQIRTRERREEKTQELIKQQLKDTPEASDRQIGSRLGVDGKTVGTVRSEMEATSEIPKLVKRVGADGKERPSQSRKKKRSKASAFVEYAGKDC